MMSAQDILDSPVYAAAYAEIEADLWTRFRGCDPTDSKELQGVALRLWAIEQVRAEFERRMTKGVETRINGKV